MQPMQLCISLGGPFENTFVEEREKSINATTSMHLFMHAVWEDIEILTLEKNEQLQPMQLLIRSSKQFEGTF